MTWQLGPFTRVDEMVLRADRSLPWATKDLFNPGAVVHDGRVCLLVRGEDDIGPFAGTSRIGLATSDDGVHFTIEPEPVLSPSPDGEWSELEWPGGCEDPRVCAMPDGGFVCTYTGFDGARAVLMVATSPDLREWTKHGPAFAGTPYEGRWSKSGAIVTDTSGVATRVGDSYWMYWGEGLLVAATSDDVVHWSPVTHEADRDRRLTMEDGRWSRISIPGVRALRPVAFPRRGRFDSLLVEPGPPAVLTSRGIVALMNGSDGRSYRPGQLLFDASDPTAVLERTTEPFLADFSKGQVDDVCFVEGLVRLGDEWLLYFGMADSRIGCARAPFVSE